MSRVIEDHDHGNTGGRQAATKLPEPCQMERLLIIIDELSKRADESDLLSLLATSRRARLYNADLARELRDVVGALRKELDRRQDGPLAGRWH